MDQQVTMSTTSIEQNEHRILCVGMCVLDIIHYCEEFPAEDTDKRCLTGYWQRGGNCSNICTVLRQLNANCEFFGMLSSSPGFAVLLQDCKNRGIVTKNCPTTTDDPPFSSIILSKATGSRTIIHSNNNFPIVTYEAFRKLDLSHYTWIHFEARNPDETLKMLQDICNFNNHNNNNSGDKGRITVSLDLEKLREDFIFLANYVDYVFLGKDLAKHLGWHNPNEAAHGLRSKLKSQSSLIEDSKPNIICPWGGQSVGILSCDNKFELLPVVKPAEILDTLGAGDTFCAATIHALHVLHMTFKDAIQFGIRCAGFKIAHRGYDDIKIFYEAENGA